MITAELVQLFRSLKKSAIVLLLMKWAGRPLGEAEVAAILDSSRTTVRSQLKSLAALGYAHRVRFHDGFELTKLGEGLFEGSTGNFFPLAITTDPPLDFKMGSETETGRKGKNLPVGEEPASPQPVDPEVEAALRRAGIMLNARTRRLARMEHVTPQYIRLHQQSLYLTRGIRSPGLLVSILESGQPPPDSSVMERRDYLGGEYGEFVEH